MDNNSGLTNQKSDLLAVFLSFAAGVIQLLLFILGAISQISKLNSFFAKPDFVPLSLFLSLIVAMTLVGVFSYHQKNRDFISNRKKSNFFLWIMVFLFGKTEQSPNQAESNPFSDILSKNKEKRILKVGLVVLFFSCYLFITSTFSYLNKKSYLLVNTSSADFIQIISFMALWIVSTFIIFVWVSNEIEKSIQYKPNEFVPNLIRTLQNQGYINIKITDDFQFQNGNHLVKVKIQDKYYFFITQFDGKKIIRSISKNDFNSFLNQKTSLQQ